MAEQSSSRRSTLLANLGGRADAGLERNVVRRLGSIRQVRRFVFGWVALVVLLMAAVIGQINALGGYYQQLRPAPGGIYTEGIVGAFTTANPLYATGQVDDAVSKLLFAGLLTFDRDNRLVGDLASGYKVDTAGTTYTVSLKRHLSWHDGYPLTAKDVAFTYKLIQDPDAQSPLYASWQNVAVTALDDQTVQFKLPNPLSSFPYSLTTGIVPQHLLASVGVRNLRANPFNTTKPIGAGPFKYQTLQVTGDTPAKRQVEVALQPFADYRGGNSDHQSGQAAKLASFVVHSFPTRETMLAAFRDRSITAMAGLSTLPDELRNDPSVRQHSFPLSAATMTFFKTTSGVLADSAVRRALVSGADPEAIRRQLGYETVPVTEPLLQGQLGYNPATQQLHTSVAAAQTSLASAGWLPGSDGIRVKNGQRLSFKLYAENSPEYGRVTSALRSQWRQLGADVQVYLQANSDLRSTAAYHSYDALLYGISIGLDPDVFAYWDSSQADVRSPSRLNFSEYKSPTADEALEAGRTRSDPSLRAIKYQAFLQAWQQDAPALGLYQPRFLYVTRGTVHGLDVHPLTIDTDRFNNVNNWMTREVPTTVNM